MKHYTKEQLDCYRHHQMSVLGRVKCAAHLKECDECAKLLVELEQDDSFVDELREGLKCYQEAGQPPPASGI